MRYFCQAFGLSLILFCLHSPAFAGTATIEGSVRYADGRPVHNALVLLVQLRKEVSTDHEGNFRFISVPAGTYDLVAQSTQFTSQARLVTVTESASHQLDFVLQFTPIRESITVTATGRHETTFDSVHSVSSVDAFELAGRMSTSIGEVLERETGVAKRSFGPGNSRPIVRGFDGDRVLVMQDGIPLGALGSQSGDHSEPVDPAALERLEVVKGPATLLYGSNAIGGVINAISRHHEMHKHHHEGIRGQLSSVLGSNNAQAGSNIFAEYGHKKWMIWAGGGGQRTGNYESALGEVRNSKTRLGNALFGLGYFGERAYVSAGYRLNDGRYGVPFADELHGHGHGADHDDDEDLDHQQAMDEADHDHDSDELEAVDLRFRHHGYRLDLGLQDLGPLFDKFQFTLGMTSWVHEELEIFHEGDEHVGTRFDNRQLTWRGVFDQRRLGPLSGSIGFSGLSREYRAAGEEALAPPVDHNSLAFFTLQELDLERVRLQLGGRVEHTRYQPKAAVHRGNHEEDDPEEDHDGEEELVLLPKRTFTGFSTGAGLRVRLWPDGAFVANFSSSYRAPALEELYNFGPHVGNLAFEVGNPSLRGERSNGIDVGLRHSDNRVRGEAHFFLYDIRNFVFLAPTGDFEDGLIEADFLQGDSRFTGAEFRLDFGLNDWAWITTGMDLVDAELSATGRPLPRIPPLRSRLGLDLRAKGFSFRPELVLAARQKDVYFEESPTAGYGVVNLGASYTIPRQHFAHHFTAEIYNVGDRIYRNHSSFIKDLAPEIGRGIRVAYVMSFF